MRNTSIERVMSTNPSVVSPTTSVADARRFLEYADLHHLPVVEDGRLVGMLSTAELYVRTGQAEREHSIFLKALAAAKESSPPLNL